MEIMKPLLVFLYLLAGMAVVWVWTFTLYMAPMLITDSYLFYTYVENAKGCTVTPWKETPEHTLQRDGRWEMTFYTCNFKQEKMDYRGGATPLKSDFEAKTTPIVLATIAGTTVYIIVGLLLFYRRKTKKSECQTNSR